VPGYQADAATGRGGRVAVAGAGRAADLEGNDVASDLRDSLLFLRTFVAHPRQVGAVLPTSGKAVADMLDMADVGSAALVVELGAGTGSHTGPILARLGPDARLVTFEIDAALAASVEAKVRDPRVRVVAASAEHVEDYLDGQRPDVIVSALPFTSLPDGVGRRILDRAAAVLAPGGTMLVLQYSPLMASELSRRFATVRRSFCLRNVPPAFLFACRDPRGVDRSDPPSAV
jgi:phospholipid N-methyltransferase